MFYSWQIFLQNLAEIIQLFSQGEVNTVAK